jgi:hypothetical protein
MVRGHSLVHAPTPPDVNSDDETTSTISLDALETSNEIEAKKTAREKKNKQRAGRCIWAARQR